MALRDELITYALTQRLAPLLYTKPDDLTSALLEFKEPSSILAVLFKDELESLIMDWNFWDTYITGDGYQEWYQIMLVFSFKFEPRVTLEAGNQNGHAEVLEALESPDDLRDHLAESFASVPDGYQMEIGEFRMEARAALRTMERYDT